LCTLDTADTIDIMGICITKKNLAFLLLIYLVLEILLSFIWIIFICYLYTAVNEEDFSRINSLIMVMVLILISNFVLIGFEWVDDDF